MKDVTFHFLGFSPLEMSTNNGGITDRRVKTSIKMKMPAKAVPTKIIKGMGKKKKEEIIQRMKEDYESDEEKEGEVEDNNGEVYEGEEEDDEMSVEEEEEEEEETKETIPSHQALSSAITSILQGSNNKISNEKSNPILSKRKLKQLEVEKENDKVEREKKRIRKSNKENKDIGLVVPTLETANYEKGLKKLATKGVVTLFNAIAKHQKSIQDENEDKASVKVNKGNFLDMLKKGKKEDKETGSGWSALDDNLLLKTKKMKEFGRAVEGDDESESDDGGEEEEEEEGGDGGDGEGEEDEEED